MSSNTTDDLGNVKVDLPDGSALFAVPHDPGKAAESIQRDIGQKTETNPRETPDPTTDEDGQTLDPHSEGGPLQRFTDIKSPLGMVGLESLAKDEDELAKAISARSDEIYRNEFPVIVPKYEAKCSECGVEFDDEDLEECRECGSSELSRPDASERRELKDFFQSVNSEGQSMRQLGKITDEDHSRLGVLTWVLRWRHVTGPRSVGSTSVDDAQEIVARNFQELVRGDPKRVVPVVDGDGRVGGVWWTCPIHRHESVVNAEDYHDGVTQCPTCGCDLREVHYVELEGATGVAPEKYYFEYEIVMYAGHVPQAHGLDGLSPVHLVWLEQAILHWMDVYAAEYFNPHSSQTPNKFLIVHTPNPDSFERQLDEAKDDAAENPYKSGIFYNQVSPDQSASTEAQVIDVMGDEFLGQSEELRKRYENHIRTVFGVTDVFDSELEDAGGLNNEGLQLEVTDRSIAAAQQDYSDGPYDELLRYLGYSDWCVKFVPPREQDIQEQREAVQLLREAAEIGLPARMENGEPVIGDGDAEPPAQGGGPDGDPDGGPDDLAVPPPGSGDEEDSGGESGNRSADDAREALRELEDAQKHVTWRSREADGDVGQKAAEPFWDRDEDVPKFVKQAVRKALTAGAISTISEELSASVTIRDVEGFFEQQLSQPQGWSIQSLTENYADEFDVDEKTAEQAVRSQTSNLLNQARADGYQEIEADDSRFKWLGPDDDRITDACEWLKEQTNPEHGGGPVTLDELEALVDRANQKFASEYDGNTWTPHWQCRHTFVEHFE